ncbi:MAG: discoidin domain-containing protein [Thermoplasmata archaeon]
MRTCYFLNSRFPVSLSLFLLFGMGLASGEDREPLEEDIILVEDGGQLVESVGNLPDWPDEDWNGAIDGDLETWAGTVTVFNKPQEGDDHPWAIFAFTNERTELIDAVGFFMLSNAVIGESLQSRCGKDFRLEVSTEGTGENDFQEVLEGTIEVDINVAFEDQEWVEFTFSPVKAKYVKLTFLSNYGDGTYTTLGEFAVYGSLAVYPSGKFPTTWGAIKRNL